jgi:uncharacterized protein YggT (Ycf19 family)
MKTSLFSKYLINAVIGLSQTILGLRIILKLFGASTTAPFVQWVFKTSEPLLNPFAGIFPTRVIDDTFVIEFSSLFALLIYTLTGYFLSYFIESFEKRR